MRSHGVVLCAMMCAALLLFVTSPCLADTPEPGYFTVSGGWSWPVGGPTQDTYESGPTVGAAIRAGVAPNYYSGFEVGYSWYSLDNSFFEGQSPGSTFSGGNMGILGITTENDYIFGIPGNPMRPCLNLGLGYYKSFVDDATQTTGGTSTTVSPGVSSASYFGFHIGLAALINRERFGIRLDANYEHLFTGGPDPEYINARAGIIFYIQTTPTGEPGQDAD
jgi:hypothetical protein